MQREIVSGKKRHRRLEASQRGGEEEHQRKLWQPNKRGRVELLCSCLRRRRAEGGRRGLTSSHRHPPLRLGQETVFALQREKEEEGKIGFEIGGEERRRRKHRQRIQSEVRRRGSPREKKYEGSLQRIGLEKNGERGIRLGGCKDRGGGRPNSSCPLPPRLVS